MAWQRSAPYPAGGGSSRPSDTVLIAGLPGSITEAQVTQIFGAYGSLTRCKVLSLGSGQASAIVQWMSMEEASRIREMLNGNIAQGLTQPLQISFMERWGASTSGPDVAASDTAPAEAQEWAVDEQQLEQLLQQHIQGGKGTSSKGRYSGRTPMHVIVKGFEDSGGLPGGRTFTNDDGAIFVGGLAPDCTDLDLYRIFAPFGAIAPRGVKAMTEQDRITCRGYGFVNYLSSESAQAAIMTLNGTVLPDGNSLKVLVKRTNPGGTSNLV